MAMSRLGRCCAFFVAAAIAVAVGGCTKARHPPAPPSPSPLAGVAAAAPDHSVAVRDVFIVAGTYRSGASAPLSVQLWNNTGSTISLTGATIPLGGLVVLAGASSAGTGGLAVPVPGGGHVALNRSAARYLEIRCLPGDLRAGELLAMTFTFSNGARIAVDVPVGPVAGTAGPAPTTPTGKAGCGLR
jgi:hypothetical protein